ncbi:hypothetical protein F5148DRAFT_1235400 [Russula earlei]|uniref:Uncharacterized protein n=1 Tax=Russula earlei TaxID=71964 RepID=A0ACC0TYN5_9AGAM|nr:hypothetical protein F5148DRAFT_1235400 [Russula earlei]
MPTLAPHTSNHHETDSDEDLDYVPEREEQDSDTSASEDRDAKRPRVQSPPHAREDPTTAKSERQALWAKFQDSVHAASSTRPGPPEPEGEPPKRTIKIAKRHRFAGEDVVEIVDVPEDSTDAKKWPAWKPSPSPHDGLDDERADAPSKNGSGVPTTIPVPIPIPITPPPPSAAGAGASQSAASRRAGGKTLTTLEKSALDWKAHVGSSDTAELASELEANRRGGGYLEKVDFLQRVGDRKNEAFEANVDHKRRRG